MTVLFAAEADSIQDTLFRVAAQRQVVGGSRLLVDFGDRIKSLALCYGATEQDILVTSGGSFRILFPSEEQAEDFGLKLATCYGMLLDGSITVAPPCTVPDPIDEHFAEANTFIGREIRRLKYTDRCPSDSPHAPTTAFCLSSGIGLAGHYDKLSARQNEQYLSDYAWRTAQAGNIRFDALEDNVQNQELDPGSNDEDDNSFLGSISHYFPDEDIKVWRWANVEDIASLDGERANVAYFIADGNSMGKMFRQCNPGQLKRLSEHLNAAIRKALAAATPDRDAPIVELVNRLREARKLGQSPKSSFLPLLPLILAGDEIFIILPAVYALDFANRFCLAFEHFMGESPDVESLCENDASPPTLGAAVVFCKGSHPYRLAHRYGSELLKQAKRLSKTFGQEHKEWHSSLVFDQIVGSERVSARQAENENYRPTLAPYWIAEDELTKGAREQGMKLSDLLVHRLLLNGVPQKRLAELRELFVPENLPTGSSDDDRRNWNAYLRRILDRLSASGPHRSLIENTLRDLGNQSDKETQTNPGHWDRFKRHHESNAFCHGLPDLISVWEYAQVFDHSLADYDKEAE